MGLAKPYLHVIFYVSLFISLLIGLTVVLNRHTYETNNTTVNTAMSLNAIQKSARAHGLSLRQALQRLREESRLTHIIIEEDTLTDFIESGRMTLVRGSDIINMHRIGTIKGVALKRLYRNRRMKPHHFYLVIDRLKDFERIQDYLQAEYGKAAVKRIQNYNILEILDNEGTLLSVGLGVSKEKKALIARYNFDPIFALANSHHLSENTIKLKLRSITDKQHGSLVLFTQEDVLGFPSKLPLVASLLEDKNIAFIKQEFMTQKGLSFLATSLPHSLVRAHAIPTKKVDTLSFKKARLRYNRAAKERHQSILILPPYTHTHANRSAFDATLSLINAISTDLEKDRFLLKKERQFPEKPYTSITPWQRTMVLVTVLTTILFCLSFFVKLSVLQVLLSYVAGAFLVAGLDSVGYTMAVNQGAALIVAIIFPALAIISQFPTLGSNPSFWTRAISGCHYLIKLFGICLLGTLLIITLLSPIEFLKGIFPFWGIKLSFIVPLILIGLFFFLRPERINATFFVLTRLYYAPVRTAGLLSVCALIVFSFLFVARSGNFFIFQTSALEILFREQLEQLFFIRPRTKEFLFGYPLLLLAYIYVDATLSRMWIWFFNILGATALISVINSFCHLHTSLSVSLYRSVLGLCLGIMMTFVYLGCFKLIARICRPRRHPIS